MNILHLESSPRGERSFSRQIADELVALLKNKTGATVRFRDLNNPVIPHASNAFVEASTYAVLAQRATTPQEQEALRLSDELVAELQEADIVVLGMPMYNWSIPSVTKAYIDQVVRPAVTLGYNENGPYGLLPPNKKMVIVTTRGGTQYEGARRHINFADTYLRAALGFIGFTDIEIVAIEHHAAGGEVWSASLAQARETVAQIAEAIHAKTSAPNS